jgi:hypothetical protein
MNDKNIKDYASNKLLLELSKSHESGDLTDKEFELAKKKIMKLVYD